MQYHSLKNKKICVISTFGHNGIDWLHSLIDSHPDVLIMPGFSFYRTIDKIQTILNVKSLSKLSSELLASTFVKLFFEDPGYQVVRRKFINNKDERDRFKDSLMHYLSVSEADCIDRRLFFGLHFSFAEVKRIDLDCIKVIVIQEHVPWHSMKYKKIFNPYFVFMMRDPRAALTGSWIRLKSANVSGMINPYQFDHTLLYWKYAEAFVKKIAFSNRCKIMKNEDMHDNLSHEMDELCKWLSIDYNNSCLYETFLGKRWLGESVYLAVDELKEPPPENFYNKNEIEKRWRNSISSREIKIIESVYRDIFSTYNYMPDNNNNKLIDIWAGNLNCMMINTLDRDSKFSLMIFLKIVRNFSRRFLILYCPLRVRSFFNIL